MSSTTNKVSAAAQLMATLQWPRFYEASVRDGEETDAAMLSADLAVDHYARRLSEASRQADSEAADDLAKVMGEADAREFH